MHYIIATIKKWNIDNYNKYFGKKSGFDLIDNKRDLTFAKIKKINPKYIFFPHWSWIIPDEIWSNFECVVFHMTDLPYGRGGSPLQNLIIRGHKKTKISAIKVEGGIDTGGVYMKKDLNLSGSAGTIYKRASNIVFERMIPYIIKNNPSSEKQRGKVVKFKRRKPNQSRIGNGAGLKQAYDYIRMLDAEDYPKAYLETKELKFEFSKAKFKNNKLTANVEIYEK